MGNTNKGLSPHTKYLTVKLDHSLSDKLTSLNVSDFSFSRFLCEKIQTDLRHKSILYPAINALEVCAVWF